MAAQSAQQKLSLLQEDIENDEQWKKDVLSKRGLSVVDVYPDWAGACLAMKNSLIRFKLVEGGDDLHLFTANANTITTLARFTNHSEPTWMFIGSGKLVNLYIGCSCPEILRLVRSELRRERRAMAGKVKRKVLPFGKLTPAEKRRQGRADTVLRREREREAALRATLVRAARVKAYRQLAEALRGVTAVLYLPHSLGDEGELPTIAETLKDRWREMGFVVTETVSVNVTEEQADNIFWERRLPQHKELVESFQARHSIAMLVRQQQVRNQDDEEEADLGAQGDAPMQELESIEEEPMELGQIERIIAESIYGFYPATSSTTESSQQNDSPSEFFSPVGPSAHDLDQFRLSSSSWLRQTSATPQLSGECIFRHEDEQDEEETLWGNGEQGDSLLSLNNKLEPKELRPVVDSAAGMLLKRRSVDNVILPGLWTPLTPLSKAAAVRALFPDFADQFYDEEPIPPPPPSAVVVVFRAYKRNNARRVLDTFTDEILQYAFFTDDNLRLADNMSDYEALRIKEPRDKLVIAVASTRSAPLLALAEVGTSYISPNMTIGKMDLEEYFSKSVSRAPLRLVHASNETSEEEEESIPQARLPTSHFQIHPSVPDPLQSNELRSSGSCRRLHAVPSSKSSINEQNREKSRATYSFTLQDKWEVSNEEKEENVEILSLSSSGQGTDSERL